MGIRDILETYIGEKKMMMDNKMASVPVGPLVGRGCGKDVDNIRGVDIRCFHEVWYCGGGTI